MVEQLIINNDNFYVPDANQLITEDDSLDNFATANVVCAAKLYLIN
ncbi:hypothetical protein NIES2111_51020 [Nostoc sp. NIES-2111]|nr:hypothetical protein NIES2111_51020 [Nostoc sp. NIES-2111]